jgi:hypothetical protein
MKKGHVSSSTRRREEKARRVRRTRVGLGLSSEDGRIEDVVGDVVNDVRLDLDEVALE